MKRKLFLSVIAVLIFSLTCAMLLVACNPKSSDEGDGDKGVEIRNQNSTEILAAVWKKLSGSVNVGGVGKQFAADFEIVLDVDNSAEDAEDAVYTLVGRANIDVTEGKESEIFVELKETKGETSRILAGFAYEAESVQGVATPYFYVNINDGGYRKINGYSLTQLAMSLESAVEADAQLVPVLNAVASLVKDPTVLFPVLVDQIHLFEKQGVVSEYGAKYTLDMNVDGIFGFLVKLLGGELIDGINLPADQLDGAAKAIAGLLGFEEVENLSGLLGRISEALKFVDTQLVFDFTEDGVFEQAQVIVDYNANVEGNPVDKADYTATVTRAYLGTETVDVFGTAVSEDVRAQSAVNLLNFSVSGNAVAYTAGEISHRYVIDVQSDIDAVQLFNLIGNTDKENILAVLGKLGYFHLEINEVDAEGVKQQNIITLHSKFDEGFAVVNANLNDANYILPLPIGLGGVYNFDGLIDIVGMLTAEEEGAEAQSAADGVDIFGILSQAIGFIHAENMAEDGVNVEIKDLVTNLVESLGLTLDDTLRTVLEQVLGCDTIDIRLAPPVFGECVKVDSASVEHGIRTASGFANGKTDFIKEIVSLDGLNLNFVKGDSDLSRYTVGKLEAGKCFEITGRNLKGAEVKTSGFVMAVDGLDLTKGGEQDVRFYIAIGTDIISTLSTASLIADINVPDNIPLSGVLVYETKVNVLEKGEGIVVSFENLAEETEINLTASSGKTWFSKMKTATTVTMNVTRTVGEEQLVTSYSLTADDAIILKDGKDVTAEVRENGMTQGVYEVTLGIGDIRSATFTFLVDDAYLVRTNGEDNPAEVTLGEAFTLPAYSVFTVDADGNKTELSVEPQYKLGSYVKTLEELFDVKDGVYYMKKDLSFVGQKFSVVYKVDLPSGSKELKVDIPVVGPKVTKPYSVYFGNSASGQLSVDFDGTVYTLEYMGGKWVAVAPDGQTKDVVATFEWTSAGSGNAVVFNDDGYITNYPSSGNSAKVYYTFEVDGYTYGNSFTAYKLYATNKTGSSALDLNEKLDGMINYVNYISYYVDGEETALEFKYGASGYALYVKGTDTVAFTVDVAVFNGDEDVTSTVLVDGGMSVAGKAYKVQYTVTVYDATLVFSHNVDVNE